MNKLKGKGVEAEELNRYMATVRHKELVEEREFFTVHDVKDKFFGNDKRVKMLLELFDEHNRQMKKLINIEFALGTYKRYHTTRNHVAEFIKLSKGNVKNSRLWCTRCSLSLKYERVVLCKKEVLGSGPGSKPFL